MSFRALKNCVDASKGQMLNKAEEKLIVALDYPNAASAEKLVGQLAGTVAAFKVGLELFVAEGPGLLDRLRAAGARRFFLDLKFHDIPNTMAGAVGSAAKLGVWMLNVHASSGSEAMKRSMDAAIEGAAVAGVERPLLIAVTVLTSISGAILKEELHAAQPVELQVSALAKLAKDAGLDGVVAPAPDTVSIRQVCGKDFLVISPGIRPAGVGSQDQQRIDTPSNAISRGSSYLVVGRPITQAENPMAACEAILAEIAAALETQRVPS